MPDPMPESKSDCSIEIVIERNTKPQIELWLSVPRDSPIAESALEICADAFTDDWDDAYSPIPLSEIGLIQLWFNTEAEFETWTDTNFA